jgi:hypothetical protein
VRGDQPLPQEHVFRPQRILQGLEILGFEGAEEAIAQVSLTEMCHGFSCLAGESARDPSIINTLNEADGMSR